MVGREININSAILALDNSLYVDFAPQYKLKNAYYLDDSIQTGGAVKDKSDSVYFPDREEEETVYDYVNVEMLTLEQLKKEESFTGFNFENDWMIQKEGNYKFPVLKNVAHIEKELRDMYAKGMDTKD